MQIMLPPRLTLLTLLFASSSSQVVAFISDQAYIVIAMQGMCMCMYMFVHVHV